MNFDLCNTRPVSCFAGLLTVASLPFAAVADDSSAIRGEFSSAVERVIFDRNDNDFIGASEASKWTRPSIQVTAIRDVEDQASLVAQFKAASYLTGGVVAGSVEDDSPQTQMAANLALIKNLDSERSVTFGLDLMDLVTTQTAEDSKKQAFGYNLGYARSAGPMAYTISAGALLKATEEAQDALVEGQYLGGLIDYAVNDRNHVGVSYHYFVGDEFDGDERKSEQVHGVASLYAASTLGAHRIGAGVRYTDMRREDMEGSNIGEKEYSHATGVFFTYRYAFGQGLARNENLLLNHRPDFTEFVMVAGSLGD